MKKILALVLASLIALSLTACSNNSQRSPNSRNSATTTASTATSTHKVSSKSRILIAYFTYTDHTAVIARQIHDRVGGNLVRIKTVKPYPKSYNQTVDQAQKEQSENARPKLATRIPNMQSYNIVFLGFPNWWGTMPMALFTFLEQYNFSGKTIIPFVTHEGSEFGQSLSDLHKEAPKAKIANGLAIRHDDVYKAQGDVDNWLRKLGMFH